MDLDKPKKIFIVDDDTMLTEALKDYLTRRTLNEIRIFNTGEECLKHLTAKPDVIILDYYLNSVQKDAADGMEILQVIRKHYPDIHVIMLSSQDHYAIALQTLQKGAEQYVIKDKEAFGKIESMIRELN
ncbi:MAG: response regulator [Bacteroidetes bacterium]|nr:response regulator [Bacteroidota bacterium]